jgi:deoxyribodipyrimidine photolyase-related protein
MSDYKKGEWCDSVDGLYWRFINKNRDFYKKNPRMSFVVNTFDKMKEDRKQKILKAADTFIEKVSYL